MSQMWELPAYSVLMSVYKNDRAEYLNAAIASMVAQTVPFNDMVIVCDGPLGAELDGALASWENRIGSRIVIHRLSENHGLGYALNAGLPLCSCRIVARMDSDDVSRANRCERLLAAMVDCNLDLVGGAIEEFDQMPGDMGAVRMPPLSRSDLDTWLKGRNPFNHMSVIYDRHVVEEAGGYEPFPWMEDYWLWARMIAKGCRCANVPDIVVDVRAGDGMYARRSGFAYLKSQVRFFGKLYELGLINRLDQAKAVSARTLAAFLPIGVLKVAYNSLLRERSY